MPNLKDARYCSRSFYLRPILASQFHILFITAQRRSKRPGPLGRDSVTWSAVTKARDLDILTEYSAKDSKAIMPVQVLELLVRVGPPVLRRVLICAAESRGAAVVGRPAATTGK